uniref:Uncharacterized protein n=1 Tax=Avena sativa TaxID=4498 RepID=A0ACD5VB91_AVESA
MAKVSVFSDGVVNDEAADGEGATLHRDVPWTLRSTVRRELQDIGSLSPASSPEAAPTGPQTESPPSPPSPSISLQPTPAQQPGYFETGSQYHPPPPSGGRAGLFIGASAGAVVIICLILSAVWFLLRRRRRPKVTTARSPGSDHKGKPMEEEEEEFEKWTGPRRFVYNELAVATRFFSDEEKLGEGGFGSVYHGYLKETNVHVAVKRVSKGSQQGKKEYVAEVRVISQLRHRNLVQLVGWCHDDSELLLVYELMPNGSLDMHIHNQEKVLSWSLRHEIVLGVGSALLYLHEEWEQCVLHRDIKPSNLMLDASFKVKLGDFGLARLVDHGHGSHTTMLMGTMGYMDPESMVSGKASTQSDVYSFGVVVLEIISGRRPILVLQGNQSVTMQLVQVVWELYGEGRILDAADTRLDCQFDGQVMERMMVAALWCVHPDSSQRPTIRQVLSVMRSEAPLPILPAKMPVPTFAVPVDIFLSQSLHSGSSSYGTGATRSSTGTTRSSSAGVHTSSTLPR